MSMSQFVHEFGGSTLRGSLEHSCHVLTATTLAPFSSTFMKIVSLLK